MSAQSTYLQEGCLVDYTATAACSSGDIVKLPNGLAGQVVSDIAAGALGAVRIDGIIRVAKTANIALLPGGDVFWDVSAGAAHFRPDTATPDFRIGICESDAVAADTEVLVRLNGVANYEIDLHDRNKSGDGWVSEETLGLGFTDGIQNSGTSGTYVFGVYRGRFDAVAEAAQAALYPNRKVTFGAKPIMEARVAVYDIGDNAALDINIGLANGSHATNFDSVTRYVVIHLDGTSLVINTQSTDGTTTRAATTTGISAVDDTFFELWIDARDDANVKVYINGVLVDTSAAKLVVTADLTSGIFPIAHMEKTSDDTLADLAISRMRVRCMAE